MNFDVIVIGAGHAGLEAAFVCAHRNLKVCLLTLSEETIALMPCNPSIGGPAKGIVTREIDALGGMQAIATDQCQLQMKMLNSSKGPGVWALRAQVDKIAYHKWFIDKIKKTKNISLVIDEVLSLITKNHNVCGVKCKKHKIIKAKKIIVTTGTYMESITHIGDIAKKEGPQKLPRSNQLSKCLKLLGFELIRLKTGTPPRVQSNTINYKAMLIEPGTNDLLAFSHFDSHYLPFKQQVVCHLTYTNSMTHQIIKNNLKKSAMYSGHILGTGPRYCPSIEDKIVRFSDKERHQIFIEPESLSLDTMYLQGLSSSLPKNIQDKFVHTINGLEKAKILKYAYAIEYDAINPIQLWPTLESKAYKSLYFAGQVNGTSGYEEAACQGLIAGINASLKIANQKPFILKRNEAYIGVLIDDLVTKGVYDPYRLLTSRAEYRLSLRNDNADNRLLKYGYKLKLISKKNYQLYCQQQKIMNQVISDLKSTPLNRHQISKYGHAVHNLYTLLKRPEIKLIDIFFDAKKLTPVLIQKIEILIKFEGYIKHQQKNIDKFDKYENISLVSIKNYDQIKNLSLEGKDKLNKIKPLTLGQARRISGINLTDLMIIKYHIDNHD